MDATAFWSVIGEYNTITGPYQLIIFIILFVLSIVSFRKGNGRLLKAYLGVLNLYIAIAFFACFGTEPIQLYFALPIYLGTGLLFLYDSWKGKDHKLQKPSVWQGILIILYLLYPLVSLICGNKYPQMVTHIMPCPVITISIALYSCFEIITSAIPLASDDGSRTLA